MAEALAPIDDQVKIPAAVRAAAQAAEAYYKTEPTPEAPSKTEAAEPVPEPADPVQNDQADAPRPERTPDPDPQPPADPLPAEPNWEHRYRSMEGRVRQLQEINANLGSQLQNLSTTVTQLHSQPQALVKPLVTDEERKAYGDDLLSVVERKALEAVSPQLQRLQQENQQLQQRVARDEARDIYTVLDYEVPTWRDINTNADFLSWLNLPDIYSGQVRAGMLRAAFGSGDAHRVLAFFRGFISEHPEFGGQTPQSAPAAKAPQRQAARDLKDLAAPGTARPATGNAPLPAEQPVITTKDVDRFYERVRQGKYAGRVDQKNADEAKIFAAMREGRIRRVK